MQSTYLDLHIFVSSFLFFVFFSFINRITLSQSRYLGPVNFTVIKAVKMNLNLNKTITFVVIIDASLRNNSLYYQYVIVKLKQISVYHIYQFLTR